MIDDDNHPLWSFVGFVAAVYTLGVIAISAVIGAIALAWWLVK